MLITLGVTSCAVDESSSLSNNSENLEQSTFSNSFFESNQIGYLDENDNFFLINDGELEQFYSDVIGAEDYVISEINIYTDIDGYYMKSTDINGEISIASGLIKLEDGKFVMDGKTCKCVTEGCTWNGCSAEIVSGRCSCTQCTKDCKKESTATEVMAVFELFQSY